MDHHTRKLVTIVTEASIEHKLTSEMEHLGAHGYTVMDARGKGTRGVRDASFEVDANIRIEVVCDETVAAAIVNHLKEHYFTNYAMIWFMSDVEVLRPTKF